MRFVTNPADPGFGGWAIDYLRRVLGGAPLAAGLFVDNSTGRSPVNVQEVLEPASSYTSDYASLLKAISEAVAPYALIANTSGGGKQADLVAGSVLGSP